MKAPFSIDGASSKPGAVQFDRIDVNRKEAVEVARSFGDYEISIDESGLPPGVKLVRRLG